jgi:hypothetical protein
MKDILVNVPILTPIWADERKWCKYARNDDVDGASQCPMSCSLPNQRPYCRLNGSKRQSPCVFDEPNDAAIWQEIRQINAEYEARGWK